MKKIVVYYSLTGKTKSIAEGFADDLGCDIRQIEEVRKRSVPGAYFFGAFAAMRGKCSNIKELNIDMNAYDTVFIVTPVWASAPVPAINTFVANTDFNNKNIVLVICPASGDDSKTSAIMKDKILSKGGKVINNHAFKTAAMTKEALELKAKEVAKQYFD